MSGSATRVYTSYPAGGTIDGTELIGPVRQRGSDVSLTSAALAPVRSVNGDVGNITVSASTLGALTNSSDLSANPITVNSTSQNIATLLGKIQNQDKQYANAVSEFGADNTGVTSAVDALAAAFASADATGRTSEVPPGTYLIDKPLNASGIVVIKGAGDSALFKCTGTTGSFIVSSNSVTDISGISFVGDGTAIPFVFNGTGLMSRLSNLFFRDGPDGAPPALVQFNNFSSSVASNLRFQPSTAYAGKCISFINGNVNSLFANVNIWGVGCHGTGLSIASVDGQPDNEGLFFGNLSINGCQYGISILGSTDFISFSNLMLDNAKFPVVIGGTAPGQITFHGGYAAVLSNTVADQVYPAGTGTYAQGVFSVNLVTNFAATGVFVEDYAGYDGPNAKPAFFFGSSNNGVGIANCPIFGSSVLWAGTKPVSFNAVGNYRPETDPLTSEISGPLTVVETLNVGGRANGIGLNSAISGSPTSIIATGTDTDINLYLRGQGAGIVEIGCGLTVDGASEVALGNLGVSGTVTTQNITATGLIEVPGYTVAALPRVGARFVAYVSDGRKTGESPGSGTGVLAFNDGSNWISVMGGVVAA